MGAIFCTVIGSRLIIHLNPSITLGNHQCNGAAPIFRSRGVITAYEWISLRLWVWFTRVFIITKNIRVDEARAWMRKYFSDASVV
jgi:hypothetical protein